MNRFERLKNSTKYIFRATNALAILDKLSFLKAKMTYRKKNSLFRKKNPDYCLPSDYFLYETYKLDYEQYKNDGLLTAKELNEWTEKYLPETKSILEWGSGVSRVIRNYGNFAGENSKLFACDINPEMISWSKRHISNVQFDLVSYYPPTLYPEQSFDLVYAISVFTHIEAALQKSWISEIARVLKPNGIFLFTTHGVYYSEKLNSKQSEELQLKGSYTISYDKKGHRMMTTYNEKGSFEKQIEPFFDILEFYDGKSNLDKAGGQDVWIVRKK